MPFEIVRNDITKMRVDAIVNTADPRPVIGPGTDCAVHRAAGPELLAARRAIGDIAPGRCAETRAFGLPAKYVLHAVSPAWVDGMHHEAKTLREAYDAALALAARLNCESVAFPLLATGNHAFPQEVAMRVAIDAFTDFLMRHEMSVYLVVFSRKSVQLAGGLFAGLKSYIDDNYAAEQAAKEYAPGVCDRSASPAAFSGFGRARALRRTPAGKASLAEEACAPSCDLADYLGMAERGFTEHLLDLLKECGEKDSAVYRRAGISRQLFNKIVNSRDYQPKKSTAIQLAIGLRLDLAQTQKLLETAGYSLTRSSKADLVVQYYISRGEYSIVTINMALFDCGLPTLGC